MMKLTMRMNHTQHHTAVEQNRISGSTQIRYHTYCMVGWGGGGCGLQRCQGWAREGWWSGTNGGNKRCWLIQEVANLTRLPVREELLNSLFFLHQDTYKHEHRPQKKCKFVEFIPTHKWETQIDSQTKETTTKKMSWLPQRAKTNWWFGWRRMSSGLRGS